MHVQTHVRMQRASKGDTSLTVGGRIGRRGGPGAASSLIVRMSTGQPSVALANRLVPIERVNARLARPIA